MCIFSGFDVCSTSVFCFNSSKPSLQNSSIAFLLSKSIATRYLPLYGPRHIGPVIIAIPLLYSPFFFGSSCSFSEIGLSCHGNQFSYVFLFFVSALITLTP